MKKILLTRLLEDNQEDRLFFQKQGFATLEIPLLTLTMQKSDGTFEEMLKKSEWVFFTSQHAAKFFFQQQPAVNVDLQAKKFAVIGAKTAQVLLDNHVKIDFQAPVSTKQKLFEAWSVCFTRPTTIFYPKSNLADNVGEAELKEQGHDLFTPILYNNFFSDENRQRLKTCLVTEKITAVYLASPSLWQRFLSVFSETGLTNMPKLYCLGQTTQQAIIKDGYEVVIKNTHS
ncbi:uroporphyrinogen-III synthase [Candidatus Enterococcus ikei]|uniref:Uroporphyrinogen-III synthase n=1 Tax=Candidatus Enterococcus ikei TaxID=2815326 RepID=A0ABS3GYP4_9ENTE|nr:uroporphyrinogen-III synthase [Enterococcus sp. DIV0869a]MBO0440018.1 uroporphyrinogen-III synthase [Enterococcus sp. DIV0869a]